ncbi:MAG: HipA N-terminal domain-containing protein [Ferrimicrobium sp.]
MVSTDSLAIWLEGEPVARVERNSQGRLSFTYLDSIFDRFNLGAPIVSLSLPLVRTSYPNALTRYFLDNLLPEEPARSTLAVDGANALPLSCTTRAPAQSLPRTESKPMSSDSSSSKQ